MKKIKQVDRPFLIFRYGRIGRTLFDSATTLDNAQAIAEQRARKFSNERLEIYTRGSLVFTIPALSLLLCTFINLYAILMVV